MLSNQALQLEHQATAWAELRDTASTLQPTPSSLSAIAPLAREDDVRSAVLETLSVRVIDGSESDTYGAALSEWAAQPVFGWASTAGVHNTDTRCGGGGTSLRWTPNKSQGNATDIDNELQQIINDEGCTSDEDDIDFTTKEQRIARVQSAAQACSKVNTSPPDPTARIQHAHMCMDA